MAGRARTAVRARPASYALAFASLPIRSSNETSSAYADWLSHFLYHPTMTANLISVNLVCQDDFPKNQTESARYSRFIRFFGALLDKRIHFAFCGRHSWKREKIFFRAPEGSV